MLNKMFWMGLMIIFCLVVISVSVTPLSRRHSHDHSASASRQRSRDKDFYAQKQFTFAAKRREGINHGYMPEDELYQHLFRNNSRFTRNVRPPSQNGSHTVVKLGIQIMKLISLTEKQQEIATSAYVIVNWTDSRFSWREEQFSGITEVVTGPYSLWIPDIAIINSDNVYWIRNARFPVLISSNGQCLFLPAGKLSARCDIDATYFPFDEQLCKFRIESWVYTHDLMQIQPDAFETSPSHFVENFQWGIRRTFTRSYILTYSEGYSFSVAEFYIVLDRKPHFYVMYSVLPCAVLLALSITSFAIPAHNPERIDLGATLLGSAAMLHLSAIELMPKSARSLPLLTAFVDFTLVIVAFNLVECFLVNGYLANVRNKLPPPFLWYNTVERFGKYLLLGPQGTDMKMQYLTIIRLLVEAEQPSDKQEKKNSLNTYYSLIGKMLSIWGDDNETLCNESISPDNQFEKLMERVDEIRVCLHNRISRRKCVRIWIIFLMALDRMILCMLTALVTTSVFYLFVIRPKPVDIP